MYYGLGNSPLAPTTKEDLNVDKVYSEMFHLPLHVLDWSIPEKINLAWEEYIEKYGEIGTMYASSPIVYNGLESIEEPCVLVGCFGEMYRNHILVEQNKNTSFTIDDILWKYYMQGRDLKKMLGDDYERYVNSIRNKWDDILGPYLKNGMIDKDFFSIVEYWKRRYSDSIVVNFLNQSIYSFSMMSEPQIVEYSFIPVENKNNAGFMIKLVNELCPEVLSVPIYSRYKFLSVDMTKMELKNPCQPVNKSKVRSVMKKTILWKVLRKVKKSLFVNEKHDNTFLPQDMVMTQTKKDVVCQVKEILKNLPIESRDIDSENSDYLPKDVVYAYLLTMVAKLKKEEK